MQSSKLTQTKIIKRKELDNLKPFLSPKREETNALESSPKKLSSNYLIKTNRTNHFENKNKSEKESNQKSSRGCNFSPLKFPLIALDKKINDSKISNILNNRGSNIINSFSTLKKQSVEIIPRKDLLSRVEEDRDDDIRFFSASRTKNILGSPIPMNTMVRGSRKKLKEKDPEFFYVVIPGNNSELIKRCMKHRINWIEANDIQPFHFKWQQTSSGIDFDNLSKQKLFKSMVNHLEFHSTVSNKMNLFVNIMKFCEERNIEIFKFIPLTIIIQYDSKTFNFQFENFKEIFNNIENYLYSKENQTSAKSEISLNYASMFKIGYESLKLGIKTSLLMNPNFYVGKNMWLVKAIDLNRGRCIKIGKETNEILNIIKKFYEGIFKCFKKEKEAEEKNKLSKLPIEEDSAESGEKEIEKDTEEIETKEKICEILNSKEKMNKKKKNSSTIKVKKFKSEESNSSTIKVKKFKSEESNSSISFASNKNRKKSANEEKESKDEDTLLYTTNQKEKPKKKKKIYDDFRKYRSSRVLLQKYLENPLLYWGRKFDIRIWVLYTHKDYVYAFKQGHLKTSSVNYDINEMNSFVHLTNYSVQKYNQEFSKYESGNEVSYAEFQKFLNHEFGEGRLDVHQHFIKRIYKLIKITFFSVKDQINRYNKKYCFEIFGFDFIVDKNLQIYLLEVNTNPGLEVSSPLISVLLPRMIDDALRLTIDDLYETKYSDIEPGDEYVSSFPVDGYDNCDNMWELVTDFSDFNENFSI